MLYLFIFGRDGRSVAIIYMKITLVKGRESGLHIVYLFSTGGNANANILRTVAAMKKIKASNHIYIKRAF